MYDHETMDFIKHYETPLFLFIAHLTAASKIEAPEVLTDVALLCSNKLALNGKNIQLMDYI